MNIAQLILITHTTEILNFLKYFRSCHSLALKGWQTLKYRRNATAQMFQPLLHMVIASQTKYTLQNMGTNWDDAQLSVTMKLVSNILSANLCRKDVSFSIRMYVAEFTIAGKIPVATISITDWNTTGKSWEVLSSSCFTMTRTISKFSRDPSTFPHSAQIRTSPDWVNPHVGSSMKLWRFSLVSSLPQSSALKILKKSKISFQKSILYDGAPVSEKE